MAEPLGFHDGMCQMRDIIVRLDGVSGLSELGIDITHLANDEAKATNRLLQFSLELIRVVCRIRHMLPNGVKFLAALKSRPSIVGDYCYSTQRLKPMWGLKASI